MVYTVGEMAKLLGIPSSTLRYYDKEGLLPFVERSPGGMRLFQEKDYEWLKIIECLKKTGMSLKDIRKYIQLSMQGDETIGMRLELFYKQRKLLQEQMDSLQQTMETLNYKCWYYETAKEAGTLDGMQDLPLEKIPEEFQPIVRRMKEIPEASLKNRLRLFSSPAPQS